MDDESVSEARLTGLNPLYEQTIDVMVELILLLWLPAKEPKIGCFDDELIQALKENEPQLEVFFSAFSITSNLMQSVFGVFNIAVFAGRYCYQI